MTDGVQAKTKEDALRFLKEGGYCVIATSTKDGRPSAATVGYMVDPNLNILFLSKGDTRKVKNIIENPKVSIVVGTTKGTQTLQIDGEAKIYDHNSSLYDELYMKLGSISPAYHGPLTNNKDEAMVAVKVKPIWARWRVMNLLEGKEEYSQIIP